MSNFQEFEPAKKKSNYKKWAYKLFIYMFLINILIVYITIQGNYAPLIVIFSSLLAFALLVIGSLLTFLSVLNKEDKNHQYHISLWGYPIFIILTVISMFS